MGQDGCCGAVRAGERCGKYRRPCCDLVLLLVFFLYLMGRPGFSLHHLCVSSGKLKRGTLCDMNKIRVYFQGRTRNNRFKSGVGWRTKQKENRKPDKKEREAKGGEKS